MESLSIVTTAGRAWLASRIVGGTAQPALFMAVGTGVTPPALTDTALENELGRAAVATAGGVLLGNVVAFNAEFPPGVAVGTLTEIGLFDSPTGGVLIARNTSGPNDKREGDTFTFTLQLTIQ